MWAWANHGCSPAVGDGAMCRGRQNAVVVSARLRDVRAKNECQTIWCGLRSTRALPAEQLCSFGAEQLDPPCVLYRLGPCSSQSVRPHRACSRANTGSAGMAGLDSTGCVGSRPPRSSGGGDSEILVGEYTPDYMVDSPSLVSSIVRYIAHARCACSICGDHRVVSQARVVSNFEASAGGNLHDLWTHQLFPHKASQIGIVRLSLLIARSPRIHEYLRYVAQVAFQNEAHAIS